MSLPSGLRERLRLPAIAAPMFLVSGPDLVTAACKAGIVGAFPALNARTLDVLESWLAQFSKTIPKDGPPWAMNIMAHRTSARMQDEVDLAVKYKVPIVITALGSPKAVVDQIKAYGGLVFADVVSLSFAQKAAAAGVNGLVLVGAGAGGHTGSIAGFAFVPAVREFFKGTIVLGGGIGTGQAIRAAEILGADLAYLGTRFIASQESMAVPGYKQMLIDANAEDIIPSAALTGVTANWLRQSLIAAGYDPKAMPEKPAVNLGADEATAKKWRDVWSAGQGVGAIREIEPMAAIIEKLASEYRAVA